MRVIAGLYRGRTLRTVKDFSVRPATDRVKQTIFDMLAARLDLDGVRVLDLFAGSGSLGIEALSRGADHVTFVEFSEPASQSIEQNLRTLGCENQADILRMDALHFIRSAQDSFDLIFADPPYAFELTPELPRMVFENHLLKPPGYLLIEHATRVHFEGTHEYRLGPSKRFGRTVVTFFQGPVS